MKKTALPLAIFMSLAAASCANQNADQAATAADSTAEAKAPSMNIRFIDADSITTHYNLAKDFKDIAIRAISKLENAQQNKGAEIQRFAAQIEQKYRSNGYLSQASYEADMNKLNKMQQDAQNYLANLQNTTDQEMAEQRQQLNDSIENYIKIYNAGKGYDAILYRHSGVYFNPDLDITNEIIEGLNARYNKVEKAN
ncbi:OmpH family outer membrane protein [Paramuribaculum intestinale]|jgi:outer membrane protein|uniref:OmpH family outer membrane protein n=5 Tax=Paramuribaculum intestinale TaxID=2094151 RepID=A0A2V1IZG0_9BACT|nr:OmpH family outer membrane protein [Paramuribaculum intestinale]MBJ2185896.1 OmpH family outer membrane protein [Muribaculaceae bacterium]ROS93340.1 OmpH family outer membrane protein [Muribaculaceae bacterium Isolate-043 (Harlan)]ROT14399.1 OmpH family outer membrane protein [Muribaculaceae bacterium Isolate-105 (HZI)]RXE62470.1 OmpH family outer membrane protein [Muribaculaceae bacterium Isolate-004 (NCI)]MCX4329526.1 OmpH family outer membrane protein [Paramuribaculum intestinale]